MRGKRRRSPPPCRPPDSRSVVPSVGLLPPLALKFAQMPSLRWCSPVPSLRLSRNPSFSTPLYAPISLPPSVFQLSPSLDNAPTAALANPDVGAPVSATSSSAVAAPSEGGFWTPGTSTLSPATSSHSLPSQAPSSPSTTPTPLLSTPSPVVRSSSPAPSSPPLLRPHPHTPLIL